MSTHRDIWTVCYDLSLEHDQSRAPSPTLYRNVLLRSRGWRGGGGGGRGDGVFHRGTQNKVVVNWRMPERIAPVGCHWGWKGVQA